MLDPVITFEPAVYTIAFTQLIEDKTKLHSLKIVTKTFEELKDISHGVASIINMLMSKDRVTFSLTYTDAKTNKEHTIALTNVIAVHTSVPLKVKDD